MKRKYVAVLMGIMVAGASMQMMVYAEDSNTEAAADAGATTDTTDESGEEDAFSENDDESQENVVLGEIKAVSDSEITLSLIHI